MPYFTMIAALLVMLGASSTTAPLRAAPPESPLAMASDEGSYDDWDDEDDDADDRDTYGDRGDFDDDDDDDDSAHGPDDDGEWEIEDGPRNIRA